MDPKEREEHLWGQGELGCKGLKLLVWGGARGSGRVGEMAEACVIQPS